MAKKRKPARKRGVDIRPKGVKKRKPWNKLSPSTQRYWRRKVDIRPISERRNDPLDRLPESARAMYTRRGYLSPRQRRLKFKSTHRSTKKLPKSGKLRTDTLDSLPPAQRRAVESELSEQGFGQFTSVSDYDTFREEYKKLYGEYPDSQMEYESVIDEQEDYYYYEDNEGSPKYLQSAHFAAQ